MAGYTDKQAVWNPKTGTYEPYSKAAKAQAAKTYGSTTTPTYQIPNAIWNPITGGYVNVASMKQPKYSISEALQLAPYGYTGMFTAGGKKTVGLIGQAWQNQQALWNLKSGQPIDKFKPIIDPNNLYASRYLLAAKPITQGFVNQYVGLKSSFEQRYGADGSKYINQYGHLPSADSKYAMLFAKSSAKIMQDASLSAYQNVLAKELKSIGQTYLMNNQGQSAADKAQLASAAMLINTATRYTTKKGKYDKKAIAQMEQQLGITNGFKQYHPDIVQAMGGVQPPNDAAQLASMPLLGAGTGPNSLTTNNNSAGATNLMQRAMESNILRPEKVKTNNPLDFVGSMFANVTRGIARMTIGIPLGLVAVGQEAKNAADATVNYVSDIVQGKTAEFGKGIDFKLGDAIWADFAQRYYDPFARDSKGKGQNWYEGFFNSANQSKFWGKVGQDPVAPILDVLSVVPVVGWAAKGAELASTFGKIGRVGEIGGLTVETAAEFAKAETTLAKAAGKATKASWVRTDAQAVADAQATVDRIGVPKISGRTYRSLMRKAIVGDAGAASRLEHYRRLGFVIPDVEDASKFTRFAAKFEESQRVLKNALAVGEAPSEAGLALQRLPASPLARGGVLATTWVRRYIYEKTGQKVLDAEEGGLWHSPKVVKTVDTLVNLPLVGYAWQYNRALKSSAHYFHGDLASMVSQSKELLQLYENSDITQPMERAVMAHLNGGDGIINIGDPAFQRRIAQQEMDNLNHQIDLGELRSDSPSVIAERERIQAKLDRLPDDVAFREAHGRLANKIADPSKEMDAETEVAYAMMQQLEHQRNMVNRLVHDGTSPNTLSYLRMVYAEAMQALRIRPEHLFGKDGRLTPYLDRVIQANENIAFHEGQFDGVHSWIHVRDKNGNNVFEKIKDPAVRKQRIEEFQRFLADLKRSGVFRDGKGGPDVNGVPIFVLAKGAKKNGKFIKVHIPRLDGGIENGKVVTHGLVDEGITYELPRELFDTSKVDTATAAKLFEEGSLNAMADISPNPHYFSEKVSESGLRGERYNFTDLKNEHVVATNGLKQHTIRMQILSQIHYLRNRVERDLEEVANANAVMVPMDMVLNGSVAGSVLKSVRVFRDPIAAEEFAKLRGTHNEFIKAFQQESDVPGSTLVDSPFDVNTGFGTIQRNGETLYVVRGDVRDWAAIAQQEVRSGLKDSSVIDRVLYENMDDLKGDENTYALVVPPKVARSLKETTIEGNDYASRLLNQPLVKGPSNVFKRLVLNMNPRFISTNIIGGLTMMMMYNPYAATKMLTRAMVATARRSRTEAWRNLVEDLDILHHHMAYEFDHNIYKTDMGAATLDEATRMGKFKKYGWNFGYTTVRAFEEFIRKNVAKDFLENDPFFRDFMRSPEVARYIKEGIDFRGMKRDNITPFEAAADMLLDPSSKFYRHDLKMRMRYTANTVSGNYHMFSPAEQVFRNIVMPFYSWQRHSLAFTWRMPIDRPLTSALLANTGSYGYTQAASMGLPSWMYQTVPMPEFIRNALGIQNEDYRIDLSSISPFGTTGDMAAAAENFLTGNKTTSNLFEFTNPIINTTIKKVMGVDPITGAPDKGSGGFFGGIKDTAMSLPGIRIPKGLVWDSLNGAYEQDALSYRYKAIDNASDIFRTYAPGKDNWRLSVPQEGLNIRPGSYGQAVFDMFFPVKPYDINANRMAGAAQREAVAAGVFNVAQQQQDKTYVEKFVNSVQAWQQKRDYVMRVWLPVAQKQLSPDEINMVLLKLNDEKPKNVPKGLSFDSTLQMLGG